MSSTFNTLQWLNDATNLYSSRFPLHVRGPVFFQDGSRLSVQCSVFHYCTIDDEGNPKSVEIMAMTDTPAMRELYARLGVEDFDEPIGHVPLDKLDAVIADMGLQPVPPPDTFQGEQA